MLTLTCFEARAVFLELLLSSEDFMAVDAERCKSVLRCVSVVFAKFALADEIKAARMKPL